MNNSTFQKFRYRPEIDGLRFLAISSVFLFHLDPKLMPGGFVGVDIFFVISGFLITSVLLNDLNQKGSIGFAEFYNRRIKRIIPSILLVTFVSWILAFFLMLPSDFYQFARSAIATLTFSSNFFFAKKIDYFAPSADEFPLLHTWSLAIEEQFYIVWPIALMLIWKARQLKTKVFLVVGLIIASIVCSVFLSQNFEYIKLSYYLPWTRAYELLLGCLCAIIIKKENLLNRKIVDAIIWVSLSVILGSFYIFSSDSIFPGLNAITPCLATALFIYFSSDSESFIVRLLKTKLFTFIGQHSYSIYLWHWPILAFMRYSYGENSLTIFQKVISVSFTLFLAYLTKKFFEAPLYEKKFHLTSSLKRYFIIPTLSLGLIFHVTKTTKGDLFRAHNEKLETELFFLPESYCHNDNEICQLTKASSDEPRVLLIGDSHAGHYTPFFNLSLEEKGFRSMQNQSTPVLLYCFTLMKLAALLKNMQIGVVWIISNF